MCEFDLRVCLNLVFDGENEENKVLRTAFER